jgi:hypothetical protein
LLLLPSAPRMALAYLFYFSVISAFYANISTNTVKTTQSGQIEGYLWRL